MTTGLHTSLEPDWISLEINNRGGGVSDDETGNQQQTTEGAESVMMSLENNR